MTRSISLTTILITLVFCIATYAGASRNLLYLKPPMVQWEENRLTGELKNVPVSMLLQDLIKSENHDCAVTGQLQGAVSISFENVTPEEIIRKIMRNNSYDFTLVSVPESTDAGGSPGIGELTIYQGDDIVRFTRVPLGAKDTRPAGAGVPLPAPPAEIPGGRAALSVVPSSEEFEKLDQQIKAFLDDMLDAKKISREEYEKALVRLNESK